MLNYELNQYYGYRWNGDEIDKAKEGLSKLFDRTTKYKGRFKTKNLTISSGCLNYHAGEVKLSEAYELSIKTNEDKLFKIITLEDFIQGNFYFKYNRKYHILELA